MAFPPGSFGSRLEHFETTYLEYLHEAHVRLEKCTQACHSWQYPYDGKCPTPSSLDMDGTNVSYGLDLSVTFSEQRETSSARDEVTYIGEVEKHKSVQNDSIACDNRLENYTCNPVDSAIDNSDIMTDEIPKPINMASFRERYASQEEFMQFLEENNSPTDRSVSVEESVKCLDSLMSSVSASVSKTSTPRKGLNQERTLDTDFGDENEMSTVYYECETSQVEGDEVFKSINDTSYDIIDDPTKNKTTNTTEFEILHSEMKSLNNNNSIDKMQNVTSFIDISTPPENSVSKSEAESEETNIESSHVDTDKVGNAIHIVEDHYKTRIKSGILMKKLPSTGVDDSDSEQKDIPKDKSVRFTEPLSVQNVVEISARSMLGVGMTTVKPSTTPNIGEYSYREY